MAALSTEDRAGIWTLVMQVWSAERSEVAITKADLLAAVNAVDSWVDTNAASYNLALPTAARNGLTTRQKVWLLVYVVLRRFEVT